MTMNVFLLLFLLSSAFISFTTAALQACSAVPNAGEPDVFDFIVAGSGAGGGPLAARLAEGGYSVLLLDTGENINSFNTSLPAYWPRATEDPETELAYTVKEYPDANSRVNIYPRARALGGSTIHNAMINIIGGTRADFDDVASASNDQSWSRQNMQAYFKKIEKNLYLLPTVLTLADHGFTGWMKTTLLPYLNLLHDLDIVDPQLLMVVASFVASSDVPILDLNSLAEDGSVGINTPSFTVDENHIRSSVYNRLIEVGNQGSAKLNMTLNTLVTRILLCRDTNRTAAYGVEIVLGAALPVAGNFAGKQDLEPRTVRARHEVIISAGVFQSPQLLMLSGIGDESELGQHNIETVVNLPGVGKNLQDHDEITITWRLKDDFKLLSGCKFLADPTEDPCLADWIQSNHHNVYSFNPVIDVITTKSKETLADPDVFTYIAPAFFEGIFKGFSAEIPKNPDALTAVVLKAHPSSRGTVRLTGSHPQDPLVIEKMHFQERGGLDDVQALVDGILHVRSLVENSLIEAFMVEELLPGKDANLTQYVFDRVWGHHACCTNPIGGLDDVNAVLNSDFQVRGVSNLRVVDASSWPKVPGYFVTTPTYMISEKAADVIMATAQSRQATTSI